MKHEICKVVRVIDALALFVYACAAWFSACTVTAQDPKIIPIGEIVRTVGCLIAWYIGHRALCLLVDQISPVEVRAVDVTYMLKRRGATLEPEIAKRAAPEIPASEQWAERQSKGSA